MDVEGVKPTTLLLVINTLYHAELHTQYILLGCL
jgi:hypothetical protein